MGKRKNRAYKRGEPFRDASLYVVACEGEKTEKAYFENLCASNQRVKVVVLPTGEDHKSAPNYVLKRANDFVEEHGVFGNDDRVWIIIDTDRWKEASLASVAKACDQKEKFTLILSNPCFELWLFLHIENPSTPLSELRTCRNFKEALKIDLGGYNPSNPDFTQIFPYTNAAIEKAKKLDVAMHERFPNQMSTRVYLLVEKLLVFMN